MTSFANLLNYCDVSNTEKNLLFDNFHTHFFVYREKAMARNFDVMEINNINGSETKSPFLIGVAGGTASGKVYMHINLFHLYNT